MLSHVIASVKDRLTAAGVTATVLLGRRHVRQLGNGSPFTAADGGGRIVVVPTTDRWGAGKTQDFNGPNGAKGARAITTRACSADVHFWVPPAPDAADKDLDSMAKVEALLHVFVRELRAVVMGQWEATGGGWNDEVADPHTFGLEYVLQIAVDVPVTTKANQPLPAGASMTTAVSSPNGSTTEVV